MPPTRERYRREHRPTRVFPFPRGRDSANLRAFVFDLMRQGSTDLTPWPHSQRRTALEELFSENGLTAPLTLCPSTTDPDTAGECLTWASAGLEGLAFKPLRAPYRAGARAWGIQDPHHAGRHRGCPHRPCRRAAHSAGTALAELLTTTDAGHPWTGRTFSAGWGTRAVLSVHLVRPDLVVEVEVGVARDAAGRWRHPAPCTARAPTSPRRHHALHS
ncbi:hypothetical protein ACIQFW_15865 [Streptomyces ardesiacus]|uniref:ATP-dependent DNA ligase n=1 Tax=Streptomyces ardesiacus TaxID=285564 RepID=UPI0037F758FC